MKKILLLLLFAIPFFAYPQFSGVPVHKPKLDIGIFMINGNDTIPIEPLKYAEQKIADGAFLSGLTYGLTKVKNKCTYSGNTSVNSANKDTKFLFKFGDVPNGYDGYFMFANQYSIRNFSLVKLDKKKDHREITAAEIGLYSGINNQVKVCGDIKFNVTSYSDNSYLVEITNDPEPGEFCFMFIDNGTGAYLNIFDFSLFVDTTTKEYKERKKKERIRQFETTDPIYGD